MVLCGEGPSLREVKDSLGNKETNSLTHGYVSQKKSEMDLNFWKRAALDPVPKER